MPKKSSTTAAAKTRRVKQTVVKRRQSNASSKPANPVGRPPTRASHPSTPDAATEIGRVGATNMYDLLGGRDRIIEVLADSAHPKAQALIDRLLSSAHQGENFATAYGSIGLKSHELLGIFQDVAMARTFMGALMEGEEVVRSLIRGAKDKIVAHNKCEGKGKKLDRKTGEPTDQDCAECFGSGYILVEGSLEHQKTYLELVQWRKTGGLVQIDARKQQINAPQQNNFFGNQLPAGEAPSALQILKKADQQIIQLPSQAASSAGSEAMGEGEKMPEEVMEAETV